MHTEEYDTLSIFFLYVYVQVAKITIKLTNEMKMRSAKSTNSLAGSIQQQNNRQGDINNNNNTNNNNNINNKINTTVSSPTSPICRCRVMYLGSSVPHITKDGLQGIQEPLRELYPDKATLASSNAGIDSWLSVWSNGILIENFDETGREVKRFFKIDALHYCAAVKYVGSVTQQQNNPYSSVNDHSNISTNNGALPKFLPLDSPHARQSNSNPPIFASILRRTTGIKVLECHAFICKREAAANALVRCCFHAYADTMYAKQIGADVNGTSSDINNNINKSNKTESQVYSTRQEDNTNLVDGNRPPLMTRRSKSIANLNEAESKRAESWRNSQESSSYSNKGCVPVNYDDPQELLRQQEQSHSSMVRRKSMNENFALNCDNINDNQQIINSLVTSNENNLKKQQKLSKSMHHLNQNGVQQINGNIGYNQVLKDRHHHTNDYDAYPSNQSTSASCVNIPNGQWANQQQQEARLIQQVPQPFYNPYASRVPSYPPQNLIDSANNGGTLRSIRSMAANSIASTLLRSKKHAKAMSMAQLNQDKITSFHQPHSNALTMQGPVMMPPVPPMFLPNLQGRAMHINGSQTMKASSKTMMPMVSQQPINFEAMTPKEMKKLLKKSAKYGIDPNKFGENGLPLLPIRPPPIPQACHIATHSKSGTMMSQSAYSDIYGSDMPDLASLHGLPPPPPRGPMPPELLDQQTMKPILVKPNPEFLKSKAGKKWLKQQKEFKKLLPPHLDGLPIVFGPPPVDALEPAPFPNNNIQPAFIPPHPGVPIMDATGYYNPHPFYGQNGRASAASTLIRYSPHSQLMHENLNGIAGIPPHDHDYMQRNQVFYSNGMIGPPSNIHGQRDFSIEESSMVFANNDCGINPNHRQYADNALRHTQKRNHMVEQSVISLGDENDYDDEEEENQNNAYYHSASHPQELDPHSRHIRASQSSSKSATRDLNNERMNGQEKGTYSQPTYEQAEDQGSYSSGIYKRGHINERAFSYSIRQEHKSSGGTNSDAEYSATSEPQHHSNQECRMDHDLQQHPSNMYHRDQNGEYYHDNQDSQAIPVNELTARLENQLNMKSFANSRIKSHM